MKIIYKTGILFLSILITTTFWSCAEENEDFKFTHTTNTISQLLCKANVNNADGYIGEIYEFDKDGNLMEGSIGNGDFTEADVEGGYGLIIFKISKSLQDNVDLSNIYLIANVGFDAMITPSLSGKHDITGKGIIITVISDIKTIRQYRIRGEYE